MVLLIQGYRRRSHTLLGIYRAEGMSFLYQGVCMIISADLLANSIFFYLYANGKKRYGYDQSNPYGIKGVFISYRAGLASMFVTAPLWTIKTRMVLLKGQGPPMLWSDLTNIILILYLSLNIENNNFHFLNTKLIDH